MASLNNWQIIGNCGKDVELRYNSEGQPMARGTLAVNERRKQPNGEYADETMWISFFAYGKAAEVLGKYATKGKGLYLQGPVSINRWETSDGEQRADLQMRVNQFVLLGGGERTNGKDDGEWASAKPAAKPATAAAATDDDGWS